MTSPAACREAVSGYPAGGRDPLRRLHRGGPRGERGGGRVRDQRGRHAERRRRLPGARGAAGDVRAPTTCSTGRWPRVRTGKRTRYAPALRVREERSWAAEELRSGRLAATTCWCARSGCSGRRGRNFIQHDPRQGPRGGDAQSCLGPERVSDLHEGSRRCRAPAGGSGRPRDGPLLERGGDDLRPGSTSPGSF